MTDHKQTNKIFRLLSPSSHTFLELSQQFFDEIRSNLLLNENTLKKITEKKVKNLSDAEMIIFHDDKSKISSTWLWPIVFKLKQKNNWTLL